MDPIQLDGAPFEKAMRPVLESLKEFRALVVALDNSPTGKLSKEMQALKTSAIGVAVEMERALEPLPAMLEKQVKRAAANVKAEASKAGRAAGAAYAEGMEQASAAIKLRVSVPGVQTLGGRTNLSTTAPDGMFALQEARNKLIESQQRDSLVDQLKLAPALAEKSARESAAAYVSAFENQVLRAKSATALDPRTLLGLTPNVMQKSAASSADVFRQAFAVEAMRGRAASNIDVRTLLGLTPNVMQKSAASSADVFRQAFAVEAMRNKAASNIDPRVLLGLTPDVMQKSAAGSADVFKAALAGQAVTGSGAALREIERMRESTNGATKAQNGLNAAMRDGHSAARGLASGFNAMWLTWGTLGPLLAGAALSNAFMSAIRVGSEFEQRLAAIRYLGGESAAAVGELAQAALDLSRVGPAGPVEIASALKALSLAGLNAKEQMAALKPVMNFAIAGELPVEKAAESLVAISTAFGYTAEGFGTVGDVIAKAAAISMSSVESMTESFKQASTVAQQYGVTVQDAATSLALLSQVGIRGTAAGTAMRNMYNELMGTSRKAQAVLEKTLNVQVIDNATKAMRPLVDIMTDMSRGLTGLNFESQQKALQALGNERGLKALSANLMALNQQAKEMGTGLPSRLAEIRKALEEAPGFSALAAVGMSMTTSNQIKGIWSSLQASLVEAFGTMNPVIQGLASDMRALFNSTEFRGALQDLVGGIAGFTRMLLDNLDVIKAVAVGYLAGKAALLAYTAGTAVASAATVVLGTSAVAASVGLRLMMVSMGPLAILAVAAAGAYAFFSTRTKSAMETATFAVDAHYDAAMSGMDKEIERLGKERKAIEDNLSGKVSAYVVESSIAEDKLKDLNKLTRATALLHMQERIAYNSTIRRDADRAEGRGDVTSAGQLRKLADEDDTAARMAFADVHIGNFNREQALQEKSRKLISEATINGRLAAEQAQRSRNVPAGDGTYKPPGREHGGDPLRDARGAAANLFKANKVQTDAADLLAREEESAAKFRYDMGLMAFADYEDAKDRIQEQHLETRRALLEKEGQDVLKSMAALKTAAAIANAKKEGSVTPDALKNELDGLETKLEAATTGLAELNQKKLQNDRDTMVRRSKDLTKEMEQTDKLLLSEADRIVKAKEKSDLTLASAYMTDRQAAIEEARLGTYLRLKAQELDLEREIEKYRNAGNPEKLAAAQNKLAELRTSGAGLVDASGKTQGKIFDQDTLARNTKTISSSIAQAIMEGGEEGGKKLRNILQQELMAKPFTMFLETLMAPLSGALSSMGANVGTTLMNAFGFRAAGGPVSRGNGYLVGENGPERFVPDQPGHIYSTNETARMSAQQTSTGTTVQVNVAPVITIDSRTDQAQVAQMVSMGMKEANKAMGEQLKQLGVLR